MAEEKKLTWIELMWKNSYLQLFLAAATFLIVELYIRDDFYSDTGFYVGISIPILVMTMIGYGGFYKFWKKYSNENKQQ